MTMASRSTTQDDLAGGIRGYLAGLKNAIDMIDVDEVTMVMDCLLDVYRRDGAVYIFGNGGSASTAAHFVNDFNKGASETLTKRFRFYCLNDNVPTVMALANDMNYDQVFVEQLKNYLSPQDVVIAISGSGNSRNVLEAVRYAKQRRVETIALVGFDGGRLKRLADRCIHVRVNDMQKVEDLHLAMNHAMMTVLKKRLEKWLP
ncbi:MAG TPA: SIS domain-containing protein [Micromonosporaceae bacterium]|jgi:D-sedoheptulose 7-phosphate isomerase